MMHTNTKENNFYVIGLSYKKADVATRSKFSLSKADRDNLLLEAKELELEGLLILSTCNRTEIIGFSQHPYQLISLLCKYSGGTVEEFAKVSYVYKNSDAAEHFIRIATGLDSQILGDYEIVGQLKNSFAQAKEANTVNAFIERLYNTALQASKEVKNTTSLSSGITTVSYAAIQYIRDNWKGNPKQNVLIYGLGKIGDSTARSGVKYLKKSTISVLNRTESKALALAEEIKVQVKNQQNLQTEIENSDVIIIATGSERPTVTAEQFTSDRKQLIIDLSIPNNVDNAVKSLPNKTVIDVDMLSNKTKLTFETRQQQIPLVEKIIEKYKNEFYEWLLFRKAIPAINSLKHALEGIQNDAITLHLKKHDNLNIDHAEEISTFIINKIVSRFAAHLKEEQTHPEDSIQVMEQVFKSTVLQN
jgi:glutamyl-tRNA reductase